MHIVPDYTLRDGPAADIVVIPGGVNEALMADTATMAEVDKLLRGAEILLAVCNAPFILGALHYLDGIRATSSVNQGLRRRFPNAQVVDDARVVDAGGVITTGTGASGIDGALLVVARLLGRDTATMVAGHLAYERRRPEGGPPTPTAPGGGSLEWLEGDWRGVRRDGFAADDLPDQEHRRVAEVAF